MPILNLNNPAFISVTGAGRPNSGGSVAVYAADGLFTTLATIYSDQQKTTPLTNPVTLDDAGAIEIWYEVKVDIQERLPDGTAFRDTLNLDPNAGAAVVQGFNLAENGSFEVDTTSDGQPDNWTISPYAGSAIAITETVVTDGTKALEFNTLASGAGGGLATSAKFPVTKGSVVSVAFSFYATNATTLNTFQIRWYDHLNALQSTSTVTMPASGSVPTSWITYFEDITVDAAGTQGEIVLTGISTGGANLTSKAYFDGIKIINMNLATLSTAQELAGPKTLTSPIINDPVINGGYIIASTVQATTSGTTIDFTSIPSWVKKIYVIFDLVSLSGSDNLAIRIGDAGGIESTGYDGSAVRTDTSVTQTFVSNSTTEWILTTDSDLTYQYKGIATIMNITGEVWIMSGVITSSVSPIASLISSGTKTLTATLDRVQILPIGANTFDLGQINIMYEG